MSELMPPATWTVVSVRDIAASIQYGHTASAEVRKSGPRFLRITDIQNGQVDWNTVPTCAINPDEVEKYRLVQGDLVFARTGATTGKSFLIKNCPLAIFASYLIRVRTIADIESAYLAYFFQSSDYWRQIERGKRGIGQPNVNADTLSKIKLPVAPKGEQRRIVAKIEELFSDLDAGVAALERVRAKLKRYRASVLNAAVTGKLTEAWRKQNPPAEPADKLLARILDERRKAWEAEQLHKFAEAGKMPPKGWRDKYPQPVAFSDDDLPELPTDWMWVALDAITAIAGGITKGQRHNAETQLRDVPYLRVANVQRGRLDLAEIKTIPATESDIEALRLHRGDILFNEGGDRDKLGRGWVWNDEIPECIHQNHVFRARSIVPELEPKLISHHGNSFGQRWFQRTGKQSVNLASINMGVLKRFPIPLPPISEQREIIAEVEHRLSVVDVIEAEVEHGLKRASRLRQAILKRAFEGKLVAQDPADEPASALLGRSVGHRDDDAVPQPNRRKMRGRNHVTGGAHE